MMRAAIATLLVFALVAPAASAHIQVTPETAAPDDAVLFEVLVPNERDRATTQVEFAVPAGALPFSYEDAPGWRRSLKLKSDQSVRSIVWRGSLRPESFARFSFLASTPAREGALAWKAIQTYDDGKKVRWIGPSNSDTPAAVTTLSKSAERQNAGGEDTEIVPSTSKPAAATSGGDGSDSTARWLAVAGLAVGLMGLGVALLGRRSRR